MTAATLALTKKSFSFPEVLRRSDQGKRPAEHVGRNRRLGVGLASGEIRPDASGGGARREVVRRWPRATWLGGG
jgi:hypothetical protein